MSRGVLGGQGAYSKNAVGLAVRQLGRQSPVVVAPFTIKQSKGGQLVDGVWCPTAQQPFLPKDYSDQFHNGGNSICFTIQHAHLMGASEIVLLGFTLQSGSAYEFGRTNPVTKKPAFYQLDRAMDWLRWFADQFPGRVRLAKGWDGPLYEAGLFEEIDLTDPGDTPNLPWDWRDRGPDGMIPAP